MSFYHEARLVLLPYFSIESDEIFNPIIAYPFNSPDQGSFMFVYYKETSQPHKLDQYSP